MVHRIYPAELQLNKANASDTEAAFLDSVNCFGVRFSVMSHFMFVHNTFSSVLVSEWPPFGK